MPQWKELVCPVCGNTEEFGLDTLPDSFLLLSSEFKVIREEEKSEKVKLWICKDCSTVIGSHPWLLESKPPTKG